MRGKTKTFTRGNRRSNIDPKRAFRLIKPILEQQLLDSRRSGKLNLIPGKIEKLTESKAYVALGLANLDGKIQVQGFKVYEMSEFSGKPMGGPKSEKDLPNNFVEQIKDQLMEKPPSNAAFSDMQGEQLSKENIALALEFMNAKIVPQQAQAGEEKKKAKL